MTVHLRHWLACLAVSAATGGAARAQDCAPLPWGRFLSPGPQEFQVVNLHRVRDGAAIYEVHFGALAGDYAKLYLFAEYDAAGCLLRALSVGSYTATAGLDAQAGDGDDGRLYHIDLYEPGSHSTLGMQRGKPKLDAVRALALDVFKNPARGATAPGEDRSE
ncbi:MAG: hypothetical protein KDK26_02260 [Roseivivax sp.]|nr:hypothetical protein [Roseivivax sp.]